MVLYSCLLFSGLHRLCWLAPDKWLHAFTLLPRLSLFWALTCICILHRSLLFCCCCVCVARLSLLHAQRHLALALALALALLPPFTHRPASRLQEQHTHTLKTTDSPRSRNSAHLPALACLCPNEHATLNTTRPNETVQDKTSWHPLFLGPRPTWHPRSKQALPRVPTTSFCFAHYSRPSGLFCRSLSSN